MEAQQPRWREEEAHFAQSIEQEVAEPTKETAPAAVELDETLIAAESIKLQAELAPESFAQAPGQEEITEKELELRHEVQDDPSESQAASLGEVIADLSAKKPELQKASSTTSMQAVSDTPQAIQVTDSNSIVTSKSPSLSYVQAVKIGFVTALCLITAFAVLQIAT